MITTPVDHGLVLAQGFGAPRTPGLHMSDLYNALYATLHPARYGKGGPLPLEKFELGMAFEDMLEEGLKRRMAMAEGSGRPGEFITEHEAGCVDAETPATPEAPCHCGAGVAYSPDLLLFNGVTRLGEIKLTFMSTKGAPWGELGTPIDSGLWDSKFAKYLTQIRLYCYHLGLLHARLYVFFVRGDYKGNDQVLRAWDLTFTPQELVDEWHWVKTFAWEQGLLPTPPTSRRAKRPSPRSGR